MYYSNCQCHHLGPKFRPLTVRRDLLCKQDSLGPNRRVALMSEIQPALRQLHDPHVYALSETCPLCDQPVPNEKAQVIRARMEASERSLTEAANDRATQRITAETVRIEAAAS